MNIFNNKYLHKKKKNTSMKFDLHFDKSKICNLDLYRKKKKVKL